MAFNDIKNNYYVLKLREFKHKYTYRKNFFYMQDAMERYKNCKNKKTINEIKNEINYCRKYWGCYPLHYYRYDLYRDDKQLSKEEIINYIPEFFFYTLFLPYYDSEKYSILLHDKNLIELLFRNVGINQPHIICKLINSKIYTVSFEEREFKKIEQEIKKDNYKKVFVKPAYGQGGYGIIVFHLSDDGRYITRDGIEFNEKFISDIGKRDNYIIQSGLNQDVELSKIYPDSVNTFRITTENINGDVRVVCSTLRMGKGGNEVDNGSQDGIVLGINHNNGCCKNYATTERGRVFYKHPDTNFIFDGYRIDKWQMIKDFTIECASKLPYFTYLGWDIALAADGPVAIETNLRFGLDHYQVPLGGLREIFKIDDPGYYWKNQK